MKSEVGVGWEWQKRALPTAPPEWGGHMRPPKNAGGAALRRMSRPAGRYSAELIRGSGQAGREAMWCWAGNGSVSGGRSLWVHWCC